MVFETIEDLLAEADKLINSSALEEVRRGRSLFESILNNHRDNAGVLFAIASGYMRENRMGMAENLFRRCLEIEPEKLPEAYNNLGFIYNNEGRMSESLPLFERAMELDPERSEFLNNVATYYVNNGTPGQAIEWAEKALAKDTGNKDALWNRGLAYLELGQWSEGWEDYKAGLNNRITSSQKRKLRHYVEEDKVPYWDGTPGKNVVVYGEQGVGDEILAYSMLEQASKDANLILEAHPRLVSLARRAFDQSFPIYGTRKVKWRELTFPQWQQIDYKCPIFNLGALYRNKDSDFPRKPYMKPFPEYVLMCREWLNSLGDKPKIGISWKGGSNITRHDLRSVPLGGMLPLLSNFDAEWISLQYDPADRPGWNDSIVASFEKDTEICLNHKPEWINDLDICYGGLIHALDLVISVNTSLVHACGAMGVECWVMTPHQCAWRYNVAEAPVSCGPDKMMWYGDHVTQFRQGEDLTWDPVFEKIIARLKERWPDANH